MVDGDMSALHRDSAMNYFKGLGSYFNKIQRSNASPFIYGRNK